MCRSCAPGTQPSSDKGRCDPCSLNGDSSHSTNGVACSSCQAGSNPNADRTACVSCADAGAGFYSAAGAPCQLCGIGKQPAGDLASCVDCGSGEYSDGSSCERCPAGTQPSNDKGSCDLCQLEGDSAFSADGVECDDCDPGQEPNSTRTACLQCADIADAWNDAVFATVQDNLAAACVDEIDACEASDGCTAAFRAGFDAAAFPTTGSGELLSAVACAEASGLSLYDSRRGLASQNGGSCDMCGVGKQPASDGGSCVDCPTGAGEYSGGDRCRACPPGTKPTANKASCEFTRFHSRETVIRQYTS